MGGTPGMRISQFNMGSPSKDFPVVLQLFTKEACQIRDIALESARISANKLLSREVGENNYHIKILVYPHHVLRENKQATGAGADRVSQGMREAFGKPVGLAARVTAGQPIISVGVYKQNFDEVKEALKKACYRLPTPCKILTTKGSELVG
jgi:Ribosomal protein L16/L10E